VGPRDGVRVSDGDADPTGAEGDERETRLRALLSVPLAEREARRERVRAERSAEASEGAGTAGTTGAPEAPDAGPPSPAEPPPAGPGVPLPSVLAAVVLVALFAAGVGLTYAGTRIIRSSTEGEVVRPVDDPAAPGYEALVASTPTLAVLHDLGGELDAVTVLTLPDPEHGGGGVVLVPTRVVDDLPVFGVTVLQAAYDLGATPLVQAEMVGDLLGAGIDEVVVVDAARWAALVAPVAPLVVDNPDDLEVDGDLRFPAGELELAAEDVGPYLEARAEGQSDLARLYRHELVWRAWLTAVAETGVAEAVPGELEAGIGRFVRDLSVGTVAVETLPVDRAPTEDDEQEPTFLPDVEGIEALVAELIPFPRSPRPGIRPRVRVLSGTDDIDAARRLAPALPPLGLEVVIVGNARTLDQARTTIAYLGPEQEEAAEEIRDLLGVGEVVVDPRPSDVVEITVTLGADHE